MDDAGDWMAQFREYSGACRVIKPLPPRDSLTLAEEHQCRTVGGTILTWLRHAGPRMLQERAAMCGVLGIDPAPVIVFTSNVAGAIAAQQILGADHERVIFLLEGEYAPLLSATPLTSGMPTSGRYFAPNWILLWRLRRA